MKLLEERILRDGRVAEGGTLVVNSFLNHQTDPALLDALAAEFRRIFADAGVNKVLTVESSGIGIALLTALRFGCPMVFAKKSAASNLSGDALTAEAFSYTHGRKYELMVEKAYLKPGDRVLLIDDFLANGNALNALLALVGMAGAECVGAGVVIEKAFQDGGRLLREKGLRVEALARVASMEWSETERAGRIVFC